MSILEHIINDKQKEVALKKSILSSHFLEHSPLFNREALSLKKALTTNNSGIIAEHKRRSPSKPNINQKLSVNEVVQGYEKAGVAAISVLTDGKYFGGSIDDLIQARAAVSIPILRKEFIIDPYQIVEAKAYGADAILLIAAVLDANTIDLLSRTAKSLGLEVLMEIHDEKELERATHKNVDLIGVNNRNLKTFEVNIENSMQLANLIPDSFVKVSESGIGHADAVKKLRTYGFKGFLMGEHFMKTDNPGEAAQSFINALK